MAGRVFLVNVGANASHKFQSPIFRDGRFELLPIPEDTCLSGDSLVKYGDLMSFYDPGKSLRQYISEQWWDRACHADPEFYQYTYGDNCDSAPRAAALKNIKPGDFMFFIARLVGFAEDRFLKSAGFFLIGYLELESVLAQVTQIPTHGELQWLNSNAHMRRAAADPSLLNGFWVFKGSSNSRRFWRAVPVNRDLASKVFRTADNQPWTWDSNRSQLQTIGSYTRSCRCVIDPSVPEEQEQADYFWRAIAQYEAFAAGPRSTDSILGLRAPRE